MNGPNSPQGNDDLIEDAKVQFTGMAKGGMAHPATKPVLTGAAVGAIAGLVLPIVSIPLGLIAGAGFMFYKNLRP